MDWSSASESPVFQMAFVQAGDVGQALAEWESQQSLFPSLSVSSFEQSLEQSKQMFAQRWSIFILVLVVILCSVMLGVINTLVNNIHSRRKEYAVLRAISLSKNSIVGVVVTQVLVYLISGLLFGTIAGVLLTYLISRIDPGTELHFDFMFLFLFITAMFAISLAVFLPFANKLGKLKIAEELTQDNK